MLVWTSLVSVNKLRYMQFVQGFASMQSNSRSASRIEANPYSISPSTGCSEPWWRSSGTSSIPPAVIGRNTANSSMEQSKDCPSLSDGELDEDMVLS